MLDLIGEVIRVPLLVFGIDGAFLAGLHVDALPSAGLRKSIEESGSLGAGVIGGYFTNEDGTVQHVGTHEELLLTSPTYRSIVASQNRKEVDSLGE
jgi:hypothetical protein